MKTILKIFAITCILALVVTCFAACGNKDIYGPANDPESSSQSTTEYNTESKPSYYIDDATGDIKDATTKETVSDDNIAVDESTGNIIDKTTGDIIQTKEETDKIGDTINKNDSDISSDTSSGETTIEGDHGPIIPF